MKAIRRFIVRTHLPEEISGLSRLAANLRWSWHPQTQALFRDLDPAAWEELGHDPVALLGSFDRRRLTVLASDAELVQRVQQAADDLDRYLDEDRWYQQEFSAGQAPSSIAYFSPSSASLLCCPSTPGAWASWPVTT